MFTEQVVAIHATAEPLFTAGNLAVLVGSMTSVPPQMTTVKPRAPSYEKACDVCLYERVSHSFKLKYIYTVEVSLLYVSSFRR